MLLRQFPSPFTLNHITRCKVKETVLSTFNTYYEQQLKDGSHTQQVTFDTGKCEYNMTLAYAWILLQRYQQEFYKIYQIKKLTQSKSISSPFILLVLGPVSCCFFYSICWMLCFGTWFILSLVFQCQWVEGFHSLV